MTGNSVERDVSDRVHALGHRLQRYRFESYGLSIAFDLDPAVVDDVRDRLPPGSFAPRLRDGSSDRHYIVALTEADSRSGGGDYRLIVDGVEVPGSPSTPEAVATRLESNLQIYVAEFAQPHLFLHAGVVQWHGRLIVLPGSSLAGKSTLVRALVQAGATYYSDEFAVLDREGRVFPYPRRLSHRPGPLGPRERIDLVAHAPKVSNAFVPPRPDIVALIRYMADADWECVQLTGGEAVMAMSEHMVPIRKRPAETLQMLVAVAEHAEVYRCMRPDLDVAIAWLRKMVTRE